MKKILGFTVGTILLVYLGALLVANDPDEQRPGTRLSGEVQATPPTDWSFLEPRSKLLVQTHTWYLIPHSVTTTSLVVDGILYVPCGRCASKRWPKNVASDSRVRIKANDKLYDLSAVKVTDAATMQRVFGDNPLDMPGIELYRIEGR
ncbi:MAG: hypothetical protein GXP16_07620 [Gammaproteobacteria bacterium]|nr:hypothetical protein [Gammaproteobacteria bacterium]